MKNKPDNQQNAFQKCMPEMAECFQKMAETTFKSGALSFQVKELIAIGIAVSHGCEDCMSHHIKIALENGVSKDEITEAMAVGFEMGVGQLYPPLNRILDKMIMDK